MMAKWTHRYFLLLDHPKCLVYFDKSVENDEPYRDAKGIIDFSTITEVVRNKDMINLISPRRTWNLLAEDDFESADWISAIQSALINLQQEEHSINWDSNFDL